MICQSPLTRINPWKSSKEFYQFLDFWQQRSITTGQTQLISLALEMEAVDPLVALNQLAKPDQRHAYFEQRSQQEAVAAIGSAVSLQVDHDRFQKAQKFTKSCLENLTFHAAIDSAFLLPRVFSSFTFFEQQTESAPPFAAANLFLPRWQIMRQGNRGGAVLNLAIDAHSSLEELTQTVWQERKIIELARYDLLTFFDELTAPDLQSFDADPFQNAVRSALRSIQRHRFEKIVLAHAVDVVAPLPFQRDRSLHYLRQLYPDCHVFSVANGKGQTFIGASPERLLTLQQQQLTTDALAGSAPRGKTLAEDAAFGQDLLASIKERREHGVVVDFIAQRLLQLGLHPEYQPLPVLRQLSNIQHLHTPIVAAVPTHLHPLEILAELHPTPAVAGLPREIACRDIQRYEQFARSLYAAPIGWIDAAGNAEFIVGIRSALLNGNRARLYAGAGIVAGSNPDREFAEVRLKLQALLRTLG